MADSSEQAAYPPRRIALSGEFDLATAHRLEAILADLEDTPVQLDMGNVDFVDSTGLKVLIAARRDRPNLRIVNPSRSLRRLFEVTGTAALVLDDDA
jgi:anti-anti-sigma factor